MSAGKGCGFSGRQPLNRAAGGATVPAPGLWVAVRRSLKALCHWLLALFPLTAQTLTRRELRASRNNASRQEGSERPLYHPQPRDARPLC
ncbi:hypothetical protein AAFF_G00429650 [Aldrovandia affinis]|uniref:Uncharacterized protein n=1 Tax=Aldrovandia affinis TaxID=143900 RepID=A0AAD7SB73_9TELE|nr:hypothetical protein AAFF_G00429650 [Aldrovandia affinis]